MDDATLAGLENEKLIEPFASGIGRDPGCLTLVEDEGWPEHIEPAAT
jgi:hypothetical protein